MPSPRRLYLHIGLQKTGTSYLQSAMLNSRDSLAEQGVDLVPPTKSECFDLMVVIRERYAARREPETDRATTDRFTAQLRAAPGSRAVFSQESLAAAKEHQVERLLAACGDREVHVVVTVRDLARQLPSSWQESLKAGGTKSFGAYLRQMRDFEADTQPRRPWLLLDPPTVLARWSRVIPPDRVHVVTVPPSGSPTTLLLERFARVLDVDPVRLVPEDRPSNSSLGQVEAEVLRRVNAALPEAVHQREVYAEVVKRSFSARVLGRRPSRKILVPERHRSWCEEVAERQAVSLEQAGYQVEGTLADLRCADTSFTGVLHKVTEKEVADASVAALAAILANRAAATIERRDRPTPVDRDGLRDRVRDRLRRRTQH